MSKRSKVSFFILLFNVYSMQFIASTEFNINNNRDKANSLELSLSQNVDSEVLIRNLFNAIYTRDVEKVDSCLKSGADVNNQRGINSSALIEAAKVGSDTIIALICKMNPDTNVQDDRGYTALMYAAGISDINSSILLLEKGANLNIQDKNGRTVLMHAVLQNNTKMVKFFLTNQTNEKDEAKEPRTNIAVNMKDNSKCRNTALSLALRLKNSNTNSLFSLKNDIIIELLNTCGGVANSIKTDAKNIESAEVQKFEFKKLISIVREFVF